jgi:hypothetical protein
MSLAQVLCHAIVNVFDTFNDKSHDDNGPVLTFGPDRHIPDGGFPSNHAIIINVIHGFGISAIP